jgi:hypothetical protein
MKDQVLKIVESALVEAEDNLYRANMQFGRMTAEQLKEEYGQSGKTCGDIMQGCRDDNEHLKQCVAWIKNCPEGEETADGQIKAEIQLVGLISAIKGFAVTQPDMTVVKLDSMLKTILSFARSALDVDQENVEGKPRYE